MLWYLMESSPRVNLSHEDNSHDRTRLRSRSLALLLPSDSSRHFARIPNLCPCHDTLQQSVSYTVLVSAYISKIFSVKFSLLKPRTILPVVATILGRVYSHPRNRLYHLPHVKGSLCEPGSRAATNSNSPEDPHSLV